MTENTHIVIDGKNIIISPNLSEISQFIIAIEKEIETILEIEDRLKKIRKQAKEIVGITAVLAKNNSSDFKYQLSEHPSTLADKLKFQRPVRSECIVLFAYLETLRCLHTAYKEKIDDEEKLRDASDSSIENFMKDFCLCSENEWVKQNSRRRGKIDAVNLRKLRNSLTHFFSVSSIGIVMDYNEKYLKLEKQTNGKARFMSILDLYKIIRGAAHLLLKMWDNDCRTSFNKSDDNFKEAIHCVNNLVKKYGAKMIREDQINL